MAAEADPSVTRGDSDPAAIPDRRGGPTLAIRDLTVAYRSAAAELVALREVELAIRPGEVYGLVGESGSGKSTLALAAMRYLARQAVIRSGSIQLAGQELVGMPRSVLRKVWRQRLALVPQNPAAALNPSMRIERQLREVQSAEHIPLSELLGTVGIADPARVLSSYPHQLSGGMQQRALIAMALSKQPDLLVLDEPTTGLDSTTEAVVLDLIRELMAERETATLYVSHSLGVMAQFADRIAVLYASELVEDAPKQELFARPLHPYTRGLLDSVPRLGESRRRIRLRSIPGVLPGPGELPAACVFAPRCPVAVDRCWDERPALEIAGDGRRVRCHRWPEIRSGELDPRQPATADGAAARPPSSFSTVPTSAISGTDAIRRKQQPARPVLQVSDLQVRYQQRRSPVERLSGAPARSVRAVDGVSLDLDSGETLGLVGESGSGKSSLARAIVGLVEPQGGSIELLGRLLPSGIARRPLEVLRSLQMVSQQPEQSLNPYLTVGQSLERPLVRLRGGLKAGQVAELLAAVRLAPEFAARYPSQLSGGEKQRVAIARAFAALPELVLADEPVSALDVSVQATVLNLLNALQREHDNSMLFISHDLAVVGYLSDRVGVLYLGQLMELSPGEQLFDPPYHPYTEALLAAIPLLDPQAKQQHIRLPGEPPSAAETPTGCPFHTRCPRFLGDQCVDQRPPWREDQSGKRVFCHIPLEVLRQQQQRAFEMQARES